MKDRYLIYFLVVGLLLGSFFGAFVGHVVAPETYNLVLIKDSSDYIKYGFKDLGVYYTNNELMSFDMPFIVSKGAFVLSDKDLSSSVVGSVKDKSVLTARSPSYSYKILAENTNYYVINYHMDIKASNKTFSVDLIPSIKGVSIPKYAWWNSSWLYYKVCNIANKIDDYQMKLIIGNSSGGNVSCGGHIKQGNGFVDVRFVNSANTTEYYHWMENNTVGSQATFWVNNSDNASKMMMYYGNSACSNTSYRSGSNTFIVFDDFERGVDTDSIGGSWTVFAGQVQISTTHDIGDVSSYLGTRGAHFIGSATASEAYINIIPSNTIAIRFRYYKPDASSTYPIMGNGNWVINGRFASDEDYDMYDGVSYVDTTLNLYKDAWGIHEWSNINYVTKTITVVIDGITKTGVDFSWAYVGRANRFSVQADTLNQDLWIDDFIIRKWSVTEPSWSNFGGETTNSPPSLVLVSPVNNSVGVDFSPVCSVWCNDTDSSLLTVTWQTNNSGAFVTRQVNSSFTANSVCRYHYTWAVVNSIKYWFRVYVYDGVTNVTRWYCFTVKANHTLSANIDFVILFPVNNSRDICPCCMVFGVDVSNNVSENMTLTFSNNDTGDFEVLSNLQNGTYYFMYCGFNQFDKTYDWWLTIDSLTNSTTSDYQHFTTTNDLNCSNADLSSVYNKTESDSVFLGSALSIEPNLLFLTIVLSLWLYFVSKYFDKKEIIFAEIQFGLSMPLTLALAVFSFNYPLGVILVMLIPIFAIWILVSGFFYNKRQKNKK